MLWSMLARVLCSDADTHTDRYRFFRLEKIVRDAVFQGEQEKIQKIVEQLCHDYAYAVHQPHARNGGLIGLAAASIALGSVCYRYTRGFGGLLD